MNVFIGGTPAAGKSYLSNEFIKQNPGLNIYLLNIDELDFKTKKAVYWRNYYLSQNEYDYLSTVSYEKYIKDQIDRAESYLPEVIEIFNSLKNTHENILIEGIYLHPHLVKKAFNFPGFYLIQENRNILLKRLIETPRWSTTQQLQEMEAEKIIAYDIPYINKEAKKYGYKVFNNSQEAIEELNSLF